MSNLIPIARVRDEIAWWPYNPDGTYRLIKLGRLGCVRVGRNVFVTRELLDAFIARHTLEASQAGAR